MDNLAQYRLEFRGSPLHNIGVFAYSTIIPAGTHIRLVGLHFRHPTRLNKTRYEHTNCLRHRGCIIVFPPQSTGALLNHSDDPNCSLVHSDDRYNVTLYVIRDIVKGIELTINYGSRYNTPTYRPAL